MKDVIDVEHVGGHTLLLTFEGGERRRIDFAKHFEFRGVFKPLSDVSYFARATINPDVGTVVWPSGADVCPDVLYELSSPVEGRSLRSRAG